MVVTAHDTLGLSGDKTGVWLEDVAGAYYMFTAAGARVTLASLPGGPVPVDPRRGTDAEPPPGVLRFLSDRTARTAVENTQRLDRLEFARFHGAFYPGGSGSLWDLAESRYSASLISTLHGAGVPVAFAGCAVAALRHAVARDGNPLIKSRPVTGISDVELTAVGLRDVVPFSPQQELTRLGGIYRSSPPAQSCVVTDGVLITGQNSASVPGVVRALLKLAAL